MDDSLARLRRDVGSSSGDTNAARRYEAALLRAGKRDEVLRGRARAIHRGIFSRIWKGIFG